MSETKALKSLIRWLTEADYELKDTLLVATQASAELDALLADNALLRKQLDEARKALDELQQAEAEYRDMHDVIGDGTITAGRAWDEMRHSGDCARLWLASHPKDGEE